MERPIFYLYLSGMPERIHFEIIDAHKTYCPPQWKWNNHGHELNSNIYNLWLVNDGRGTMQVREQTYRLETGDCFLLRMEEPCSARHESTHPLTVPWVTFYVRNHKHWTAPLIHRRVSKLSFFSELVEHVILKHLHGNNESQAAEDSLRVALHILADQDSCVHQNGINKKHHEMIMQICEKIRRKPGHGWTVGQLAGYCHVSPGHFTRLFNKYAQTNPREFITRTRIEAAKGLLRISGYTIGEIADILGYGDIFHFSRQFSEHTGTAPSNYRNISK